MVNFLLGMLVTYMVCGLVVLCTETYADNDFPVHVFFTLFYLLALPVVLIFMWPARIFRNVVKPTTFANLAQAKRPNPSHWHDYGYWGWCHDPDAKHFYDRFFFYRIKKGLTN